MAEFWNTITNLAMIIPPLKGIHEVYKQNFESRWTWNFPICNPLFWQVTFLRTLRNFPFFMYSRFAFLYISLLITGIGSWMFHMTLLYEMQLLDELPMIWGSSYMVYCLYKVEVDPKLKTPKMALFTGSYAIITTTVYLIYKNPVFHEVAYGVLVATLMFMDIWLNFRQNTKRGWRIFIFGFLMYLLGFLLWNIDNKMCSSLKSIRSSMSNPGLTPITQLHGWWHILAGYATHLHIQSCIHHRQTYLKEDVEFCLTWIGLETVRTDAKTKKAS